MKTRLLLVAASTAFILTGCATTADYSEPILRIEQAINDSASSIESIDKNLTALKNTYLKKKIVNGTLLLEAPDNQCAAGTKGCSLVVLKRQGSEAVFESNYPLNSIIPNGLKALQMMKTYVSRLKSIIEADTAAKITASANATLGSLEEISNRIAQEKGEPVSGAHKITEYKEPVIGLIEWITERYVERVKKEALAKATNDAHPIIVDLTKFYGTAAQSLKVAEFSGALVSFKDKQEKFDDLDEITESSINTYVQAANDFDAALKAEAANPIKAFETAHEILAKQLNRKNDKKITLADVASAIERLEHEAKAIKALVDGFTEKTNTD